MRCEKRTELWGRPVWLKNKEKSLLDKGLQGVAEGRYDSMVGSEESQVIRLPPPFLL